MNGPRISSAECIEGECVGASWNSDGCEVGTDNEDSEVFMDDTTNVFVVFGVNATPFNPKSGDGCTNGDAVGITVGITVVAGEGVGNTGGAVDGVRVGSFDGKVGGNSDGFVEGKREGCLEGEVEGSAEGDSEGVIEGALEGENNGAVEGELDGKFDGTAVGNKGYGGR